MLLHAGCQYRHVHETERAQPVCYQHWGCFRHVQPAEQHLACHVFAHLLNVGVEVIRGSGAVANVAVLNVYGADACMPYAGS